ncbi:unnamed protein product [Prorocentrum cordatum]|uniref:Major facilitator superfamily (MFS) profile domain-containing protein n=1 Tax=Prorocentrum cordatum TaxID=2364126 RepID=A0ABN9Y5A7_9DINO|nr:unnamed protein product [Polarella glacialis]
MCSGPSAWPRRPGCGCSCSPGAQLMLVPLFVPRSSALVNVYISELAPASCRGRLGGWAPFVGTTGILVSYVVSSAAEAVRPHTGGTWRWQLGIAALPALLQLLLHGSLPETPPWLLSKGRRSEAASALAALFPKAAPGVLAAELLELQVGLSLAGAPASTCAVCAQHPRSAGLGVGVNVLQQVTGINVVIYFGPQILVYAGFNNSASMALTAIISIIQLSATLCLIGTVDRVGRKPLAKLGILLMCCGLLVIVAAFLLKAGPLGGWMAVGGMLTFRAAFSLSLGPLPYIMTSEFFQQESRAAGVALSWASNWAANCAVSLTFPLLVGSTPSPRQAWPMSSCSTPGALRWRSASCAAGCQRRRASASRRRAAGLRAARATRRPRPRPRDASPSLTLGPRGPLLDLSFLCYPSPCLAGAVCFYLRPAPRARAQGCDENA